MTLRDAVRRTELRRFEESSDVTVVDVSFASTNLLRHPDPSAFSTLLLAIRSFTDALHGVGEVLQEYTESACCF
jgi:hypothetical protein